MNFVQFANSAAQKAQSHQECTECFEPLCNHPVGCLLDSQGKRSCTHYFHDHCIDRTSVPHNCHLCNQQFHSVIVLPNAIDNPRLWFTTVDFDNNGSLSYEEIIDGL